MADAVIEAPSTSTSSTSSTISNAPTSTTSGEAPSVSTPTTERPSIKTALEVFHEAEKQQGRKPRRPSGEISATGSPTTQAETTPQAQTEATPPPQTTKGPIPFEAHETALKNARSKAAAEVSQQFQRQYGEIISWANKAATDRVGFLREVIAEAATDPQLAPQIASLAGATLRGSRQESPSSTEPPQPDFTDGAGHQFFSAEAQAKREEWLIQRVKDEILGQVEPDLEQVRSEREERQIAAANQRTATVITQARDQALNTWPHAKTFVKEIAEEIARAPLTDGHPASEMNVLQNAYWKVVGPKLSQLESEKVAAKYKQDALASTLNPASTGAPTGVPKNVRAKDGGSFKNALAWAAQQTSGR